MSNIPDDADKVFDGIIFDVYHWQQELYDGSSATFEALKRPDTILVLGILDDEKIVLLEQEQPGKPKHWSLPAGRVDEGESPIEAAKREMLEETGYKFKDWKLIDASPVHTKIDWTIYFYVAQNSTDKVEQNLDPGEKISVHEVKYSDLVDKVRNREVIWGEPLIRLILQNKTELSDIVNLPAVVE